MHCTNCRKPIVEKPYLYSTKMCSLECSREYEERAQERGGYHVLARDLDFEAKSLELAFLKHATGACAAT